MFAKWIILCLFSSLGFPREGTPGNYNNIQELSVAHAWQTKQHNNQRYQAYQACCGSVTYAIICITSQCTTKRILNVLF